MICVFERESFALIFSPVFLVLIFVFFISLFSVFLRGVSVDETITQLTLTPPHPYTPFQNGKRGHTVLKREM